eukprot:5131102-Amphidinium_carterae.1
MAHNCTQCYLYRQRAQCHHSAHSQCRTVDIGSSDNGKRCVNSHSDNDSGLAHKDTIGVRICCCNFAW